jgi:hypothetical protein
MQPQERSRQTARTAAQASWLALLVPIPLRLVIPSYAKDAGADAWMLDVVSAGVSVVCVLIGLGAGAYALARVRAVGRDGVLIPALVGLTLNLLFLLLMVVAFVVGVRR